MGEGKIMADFMRGIKAGVVAGIVYIIIGAILTAIQDYILNGELITDFASVTYWTNAIIGGIIGGIILLSYDFSFLRLGLILLLTIFFFGGTGFIRGSFACKYCKQKEVGCPAQEVFGKKK